jgi:hypothetical protein
MLASEAGTPASAQIFLSAAQKIASNLSLGKSKLKHL